MHSIEQILGLAPDDGNGMLEVLMVTLPFVVAFCMRKRAALSHRRS